MKKLYIITIFLMSALLAVSQSHRPIVPVRGEKTFITGVEISDYLRQWYHIESSISEWDVQGHKKKYFLLARDEKQSLTYAFRLRRYRGYYSLFITDRINSCTCLMNIEQFTFRKNDIVGCNGYYSTAGIF